MERRHPGKAARGASVNGRTRAETLPADDVTLRRRPTLAIAFLAIQSATLYVRVTRYGTVQLFVQRRGGGGGAVKSGSLAIYNALSILACHVIWRRGAEGGGPWTSDGQYGRSLH